MGKYEHYDPDMRQATKGDRIATSAVYVLIRSGVWLIPTVSKSSLARSSKSSEEYSCGEM